MTLPSSAWRWLAGAILVLVLAFVLRVTVSSYRGEMLYFTPWPASPISNHPENTGIPGLQEVTFQTPEHWRIGGWYVPPRDGGAAVILTHGIDADRSTMLDETRILSGAGFGVLAFDWPGNGASQGTIQWGAGERHALTAAIDWLSGQPGVDPRRIGAMGFSMGGYILAQVAAKDTRLRAVVLSATPDDMVRQVMWERGKWGRLSQWAGLLALHRSGMPLDDPNPLQSVAAISPRPLLILSGTADICVRTVMEQALYDVAGEPRELWVIPGAEHGHYAKAQPEEYARRLTAFFTAGLAAPAQAQTQATPAGAAAQ